MLPISISLGLVHNGSGKNKAAKNKKQKIKIKFFKKSTVKSAYFFKLSYKILRTEPF